MTKYTKTFAEALKQVREPKVVKESFALYALTSYRDSKAPGGQRKKGDKVSGPMTYTQAIAKAKQANVGSSVGGEKRVEVTPLKEDYEVSMAVGQLKTIQDRVGKIMDFLSGKSDDYNMEAWLQSKITSAEDKLNSVANYVTNLSLIHI